MAHNIIGVQESEESGRSENNITTRDTLIQKSSAGHGRLHNVWVNAYQAFSPVGKVNSAFADSSVSYYSYNVSYYGRRPTPCVGDIVQVATASCLQGK